MCPVKTQDIGPLLPVRNNKKQVDIVYAPDKMGAHTIEEIIMTEDKQEGAEDRVFKQVYRCRRANPHLNYNQALEVVLAAHNLHRDDKLMDLTIMIEGLRADLARGDNSG